MQWVLRGSKVSDWGSYNGWVKLGRVVTLGTWVKLGRVVTAGTWVRPRRVVTTGT